MWLDGTEDALLGPHTAHKLTESWLRRKLAEVENALRSVLWTLMGVIEDNHYANTSNKNLLHSL